ncbi:MAG: hypothetical protein IPG32_19390 [Saprospirales bacterium]|nr:hypothetical protein [Saprospirales bacterium]
MADVVFKPEFDDSEIRRALAELEKTTKNIEGQVQGIGDAQTQAFNKAGKAADQYDEILKDVLGTTGKLRPQNGTNLKGRRRHGQVKQ